MVNIMHMKSVYHIISNMSKLINHFNFKEKPSGRSYRAVFDKLAPLRVLFKGSKN